MLARSVARHPDRCALVGPEASYSYRELEREVERAAGGLHRLGVGAGDRVACALPNRAQSVVSFLAVLRLGAVWVGLPKVLAAKELDFILGDCTPAVFLTGPGTRDKLGGSATKTSSVRPVLTVDPGMPSDEWEELLTRADDPPSVRVDPWAPAAIAYTSGTTGFPKGATHSQLGLVLPARVLLSEGLVHPGWRYGVCLPLTQLTLMVSSCLLALQAGGTSVVAERMESADLARWISREQVNSMAVVPTLLRGLLDCTEVSERDLSSLRELHVGGADCSSELRERFSQRFGIRPTVRYGMTEVPTVVAVELPDERLPDGAVGRPLPHLRVHILDRDEASQPVGVSGQVCVGAASDGSWAGAYPPMLGYWGRAPESRLKLSGGLLHTGDLGHLDSNGLLHLEGRLDDVVIRAGTNVSPAEIERVLGEAPEVEACAVLGLPDARLGQRIVAAVSLRPGTTTSESALLERCRRNLAAYKVPEEVRLLSALPLNAIGKVDKRTLRGVLSAAATLE